MPVIGYNVDTQSPRLRQLQDELARMRAGGIGATPINRDEQAARQVALEAQIGNELRRVGSSSAGMYPYRDMASAMYMQQHFPQYQKSGQRLDLLGQGVIAPQFTRPIRFGAGSGIAQPRGYYRGGRGGSANVVVNQGGFTPRVVATGNMPAQPYSAYGAGYVTSEKPAFTGPKTVEEIQADQMANRQALGVEGMNVAAPTGRISYGTAARPQQGYAWIGGAEGDADYQRWLDEIARETSVGA